jgi:threonine dehydrogenase-like Zn-dependent dehydrogenase
MYDQKTPYGAWVTSIWRMQDLVERLVHWKLFPSHLATHRFPLADVDHTHSLMASGHCGKVAICFDEELT